MRAVSLCDRTGNMLKPWAEAGYECIAYDLQHPMSGRTAEGIEYRWGDVRSIVPADFGPCDIVFAFPPCQHLASSGAVWFERKGLRPLIDALETVEACRILCECSNAPWMIENPKGRLATLWRNPDYRFDPCDYGDPYTKHTCIWAGGGFIMPPKQRVPVDIFKMSFINNMGETKDRADKRAVTPMGFARAVFDVNHTAVVQERVA